MTPRASKPYSRYRPREKAADTPPKSLLEPDFGPKSTMPGRCEMSPIEKDFLRGNRFNTRIALKKNFLGHIARLATTSTHAPNIDAKTLRSCCRNAAMKTSTILGEPKNRRFDADVVLPDGAAGGREWLHNVMCHPAS